MTSSNDTFALASNESIIIDGANSVSGATGHQFPGAASSLFTALLALVFTLVVLRRARATRWLAAGLALATLPGLVCVLALRADAPARRPTLAHTVTSALDVLEPCTGWPAHPVAVSREDDGVLFPLLRYAMPSRPADGEGLLEVRGGTLEVSCVRTGARTSCESAPW